jgi:hypothetical protein
VYLVSTIVATFLEVAPAGDAKLTLWLVANQFHISTVGIECSQVSDFNKDVNDRLSSKAVYSSAPNMMYCNRNLS